MTRKVIAAIMDVVFVKPFRKQFIITKIKRCLVYDPNKVVPLKPACKGKKADI